MDDAPAGGGATRNEPRRHFVGELPEDGNGGLATLTSLLTHGVEASTNSAGPRFFHFVTGGSTPAAPAADWLAPTLDNNARGWISAPLGSKPGQVVIGLVQDLLDRARGWGGVLAAGATMSDFPGLAPAP